MNPGLFLVEWVSVEGTQCGLNILTEQKLNDDQLHENKQRPLIPRLL